METKRREEKGQEAHFSFGEEQTHWLTTHKALPSNCASLGLNSLMHGLPFLIREVRQHKAQELMVGSVEDMTSHLTFQIMLAYKFNY